tara:strand:- start:213 stop:323 length:111 start_codon:yes stop_codon:yes gene_type:complete
MVVVATTVKLENAVQVVAVKGVVIQITAAKTDKLIL